MESRLQVKEKMSRPYRYSSSEPPITPAVTLAPVLLNGITTNDYEI